MRQESSRKKSTTLWGLAYVLLSSITFLISNRVDDLEVSQESFHSSGCWYMLNLKGLLWRGCWISWTIAKYNSCPCYNNSWHESLAPGDQIVGFYLLSGLCSVFSFFSQLDQRRGKKEISAGMLNVCSVIRTENCQTLSSCDYFKQKEKKNQNLEL